MVRFYAENADNYSIFNIIVYLKRIWKDYRQLHRQFKRLRQTIIDDLGELKELITRIKAKPKQSKHTMQALETLYDLHYHALEALTIELSTIDFRKYLEYMFIGDATISKNEFLSLLNLDRSKRSQETIRNLPERIDRDTFTYAVFVDKIEDEWKQMKTPLQHPDHFKKPQQEKKLLTIDDLKPHIKNQQPEKKKRGRPKKKAI